MTETYHNEIFLSNERSFQLPHHTALSACLPGRGGPQIGIVLTVMAVIGILTMRVVIFLVAVRMGVVFLAYSGADEIAPPR